MRIVIVISALRWGGAETQVLALTRQLVAHGHAVALYTLNRYNPRAPELEGSGVQLVTDQKRFALDPLVLWRLRRFLKSFRADIVHGFLFDGDFYARTAAAGTGIPALCSERSDDYTLNPFQRISHLLSRHLAAGVVANSHAGARFAQRLYRLPDARLHVIWNGIDLAKVDRRTADSGHDYKTELFGRADVRLACMVANIKQDKDYELALLVADELIRREPSWRVVFVGEVGGHVDSQAYNETIQAQYRQLGLGDKVLFAGRRQDVLELLAQSDVLYATSMREGFPNVVLEAMAAGAPVVSTEYSDIRRILPHAWQVVEQRSAPALADAIGRAYDERVALRRQQRDWVAQHATIEVCTARLEAVYGHYVPAGEGAA